MSDKQMDMWIDMWSHFGVPENNKIHEKIDKLDEKLKDLTSKFDIILLLFKEKVK